MTFWLKLLILFRPLSITNGKIPSQPQRLKSYSIFFHLLIYSHLRVKERRSTTYCSLHVMGSPKVDWRQWWLWCLSAFWGFGFHLGRGFKLTLLKCLELFLILMAIQWLEEPDLFFSPAKHFLKIRPGTSVPSVDQLACHFLSYFFSLKFDFWRI